MKAPGGWVSSSHEDTILRLCPLVAPFSLWYNASALGWGKEGP